MIDINLMPINQRKKSRGLFGVEVNLSREILLGIGAAVLVLLVVIHVLLIVVWGVKSVQLMSIDANFKQVLPDKNEIDAIGTEVKDINKKMKIVTGLLTNHTTTWAEKFNIISDQLPKGVWITKITIDPKSMIINGMAVSKQHNEITLVSGLTTNLKNQPRFINDFSSIEVNAINRVKFNTADVSQFTITVKSK